MAAATLVFTASRVRPVFLERSVVPALPVPRLTDEERARLLAPWVTLPYAEALTTSMFLRDRSAFALDLMGTGKVGLERALALADIAVRESYRRQVPPALVLGVMLTENDEIKSTARSRQGAIGLMQINPGPWTKSTLGTLFGTNLRNDTTNLRYGVYILSFFARREAERQRDSTLPWRAALLGYNGCKRGRNTPNCHQYPEVVRREVQRSARTICAGRDFDGCVLTPLRLAMRSGTSKDPGDESLGAKD